MPLQVIFLLDQSRCVHCQAGMYMIRSVPLDRKTVQDINAADTTNIQQLVGTKVATAFE